MKTEFTVTGMSCAACQHHVEAAVAARRDALPRSVRLFRTLTVSATAALVQATGMDIIGSGGVSRLEDLTALRDAGCAGAILGKALYEGAFTLPEAIVLMKEA